MHHAPSIRRRATPVLWLSVFGIAAVLGGAPAAVRGAQTAAPLPPGAVGVTAEVLAAIPASAAPGDEVQLFRSVWEPGSSINMHSHPGVVVSCVESGALTFAIQTGAATLIRAHNTGTPAPTEAIQHDDPVTYGPGDCVAFDDDAAHTIHTAWNEGTEPAVLWEAHLYQVGAKSSTFTEAQGTPAA